MYLFIFYYTDILIHIYTRVQIYKSPCLPAIVAPQDTYSVPTLLVWDARSWRPKDRALNTTIIIWIILFSLLYCWHNYKLHKFDLSYLLERPHWLGDYSHAQRCLLNPILCVQICFNLPNHNYTSKFTKFYNYELKNNSACS